MKLTLTFSLLANAVSAARIMGSGEVRRHMTGDWIQNMFPRSKRDEIDGEKGFRPLAAMMLYMQGFGKNRKDPDNTESQANIDAFTTKLTEYEALYTNYGCYCWIEGLAAGVVGGGRTKDMVDHHCKELYRCYKCVNIDYQQNYTDVSYTVDFNNNPNDGRSLDCQVNSKQDAENICECDKRFAENVAKAQDNCDANSAADPDYGEHCMDRSKYVTASGGGTFDPKTQCEKKFHDHEKDHCCGIYPNRYPYDANFNECCRVKAFNDMNSDVQEVTIFSIQKVTTCAGLGGEPVVSADGDPHSYVLASAP